ncbi:MAG: UPF0280 family protein, partial [Pseudomonadota bacterium]
RKALVNNGGDIAAYCAPEARARLLISAPDGQPLGAIDLPEGRCGIATSGWRGRSLSRGIADAVTVLARSAAKADAAATLVANAVDLPGHPAIHRKPASALDPDSDLGAHPVVVACGALSDREIEAALSAGAIEAARLHAEGRLDGAALFLAGRQRVLQLAPILPFTPLKAANHA